jgi:PAS domain S-box-containing protein
MLLQGGQYRVLEAASGHEALLLARQADLVLLDVRLPDLSGLEVCRRLKADPATRLVPIILLSGCLTRGEDQATGLEGGGDAYLTKPADPRQLLAQVKALLRTRQAELLLQEQARVLDQVHDAVIATDLQGRVTRWNKGAERLFGYAAGEVQGQHVGLLYPPGEGEAAFRRILAAVQGGEGYDLEKRLRRKDGQEVDVHCSLSLLRDRRGQPAGVISYSVDVTERKRLEERYLQAQKLEAVGRLAGGVAHDFNNLLTAITGFAEFVLGSLPPDAPLRGPVQEILRASERGASLTRQLLTFGRRQRRNARVLDLNAVITGAEQLLRRLLREDIELATRLQPGLGRVHADPGQLEQVLLNLAVNARDAMPRGGRLTLATTNLWVGPDDPEVPPGPYVLLKVTDTGVGMDAATRARAFEPFFTTKEIGKGTGLGLATVHGIVQQSGGHIEVDSEPGQGTTFKVYLPRVDEPARAGPSHDGVGVPPRGSETVLLVEDDDGVRALSRHVLQASGYRVLEASAGSEALHRFRRSASSIDLLVTDVVMPGLGGTQLAERLRALQPGLKVLYLSGYADDAVVRHGILQAQVNFLQKPFTPAALARKVREVLDQPGRQP